MCAVRSGVLCYVLVLVLCVFMLSVGAAAHQQLEKRFRSICWLVWLGSLSVVF